MKKIFYLLFFCFAASVFAQTAPKTDDDVVKITTALVQLDANVTDRKPNFESSDLGLWT